MDDKKQLQLREFANTLIKSKINIKRTNEVLNGTLFDVAKFVFDYSPNFNNSENKTREAKCIGCNRHIHYGIGYSRALKKVLVMEHDNNCLVKSAIEYLRIQILTGKRNE